MTNWNFFLHIVWNKPYGSFKHCIRENERKLLARVYGELCIRCFKIISMPQSKLVSLKSCWHSGSILSIQPHTSSHQVFWKLYLQTVQSRVYYILCSTLLLLTKGRRKAQVFFIPLLILSFASWTGVFVYFKQDLHSNDMHIIESNV